jgi:hypothetical protein
MKKNEGYKVLQSTFLGKESHDGEVYGYTYQITFNQSLVHTCRMKGIEQGLNAFVKKEKKLDFIDAIINVWYSLKTWIKS